MKKVLITGASGMLGSNGCDSIKTNFSVTGTYFSNAPILKGIDIIKLDIRNKSLCKEEISKINPNVVIHCAAITDLDLCETNRKLAFDVNTYGTENVLESIDKNCHFIFISTDNVYNNGKKFNTENEKLNPTNIYGDSKKKAEEIILNSNNKYTILRTNIIGWHLKNNKLGLLNFIYMNLKNKKEITLFKDVFFTPISIPLFIEGIKEIVNHEIIGTFNFAGEQRISKLDFGLIVADVFGLDKSLIISSSIDEKHFIAKRPKEMSVSSSKISKYLKIPKKVHDQLIKLGLPKY